MTFLQRLGPARRALRANLLPGLVLQAFALLLVLGYFRSPSVGRLLDEVGRVKASGGYLFSALSTALFGGLIPYLVLLATGGVARGRRTRELAFYLVFWLLKGVEVDFFYRLQGAWFGTEATFGVIAIKVTVDQFIYNPLWPAPSQTWLFAWKDAGFSWAKVQARFRVEPFSQRLVAILVSTWVVWIPAVAIIYSLPSLLQVPLFNLVLCFWCLLLSFLSRSAS